VLGAGATVGASFAKDFAPSCAPPLNSDFFTQLQRITEPKYRALARAVVKDVVGLFGSGFSLTLEDYFTQLEFLAEAVDIAPGTGALSASDLRANRERLMSAVSAVLETSTDPAIRKHGGCELHGALVNELKARDTLISFNYDCVADDALRRRGANKWSARYGYSFRDPSRILGAEHWDANPPAAGRPSTVYLLKLHGSLNWQLPGPDRWGGEIVLKQRLHSQRGTPRFSIIPPVWNKAATADGNFRDLWRNAERAIRNADALAVVGFSFTPTDLHVESLFRVALANSNLRTLVIANPSARDRARIRAVFARALEKGGVIRQYDDFGSFVQALPQCLGQ
jgi:hypothetical protein